MARRDKATMSKATTAKTRLKFDEINGIVAAFQATGNVEQLTDSVLDLLIIGYVWGVLDVGDTEGKYIEPDANAMRETIYKKIAGENFEDRLQEYGEARDIDSIIRVAETELHRVYNTAVVDTAAREGMAYKTWHTMLDDKVREEHTWLEGVEVPIDADFYIGDASAPAPGMFGVPELDINCRCFITVSGEKE